MQLGQAAATEHAPLSGSSTLEDSHGCICHFVQCLKPAEAPSTSQQPQLDVVPDVGVSCECARGVLLQHASTTCVVANVEGICCTGSSMLWGKRRRR